MRFFELNLEHFEEYAALLGLEYGQGLEDYFFQALTELYRVNRIRGFVARDCGRMVCGLSVLIHTGQLGADEVLVIQPCLGISTPKLRSHRTYIKLHRLVFERCGNGIILGLSHRANEYARVFGGIAWSRRFLKLNLTDLRHLKTLALSTAPQIFDPLLRIEDNVLLRRIKLTHNRIRVSSSPAGDLYFKGDGVPRILNMPELDPYSSIELLEEFSEDLGVREFEIALESSCVGFYRSIERYLIGGLEIASAQSFITSARLLNGSVMAPKPSPFISSMDIL